MNRSICVNGPRPCPRVGCRYHLLRDDFVRPRQLRYDYVASGSDLRRMGALEHGTCALDLAAKGPQTLEVVASSMGITRERARQIEKQALFSLVRNKKVDCRLFGERLLQGRRPSSAQDVRCKK